MDAGELADRRRKADLRAGAFGDFARHLTDYRRAELHRWHEMARARRDGHAIDYEDAPSAGEARSARSSAWGSYYRMRLLWENDELMRSAESLLHMASGLEHSADTAALKLSADEIRTRLGHLADAARVSLND
jgi:hypothetical protein